MFWGLIMEPGKKYSQTVEKSFHVSQAALDLDSARVEPVQVLLGFENRNYLLCTLQKGKWVQVPLDLNFQIGDKVSFATNGPGHVHLTGYLVPEDDLDLMEDDDDEDEEEDEKIPDLVNAISKKRKASDVANKKEQNKANKKTKTEMLLDAINDEESDDSDDSDVNLLDILDGEGDAEEDEEEAEDEEDDDDDDDDDDDGDDDDDDDIEEEAESEEEIQKPQKTPKKETPKQNGVAKKQEKTPKQDKIAAGQKGQQEKTPKGNKSPQGGNKEKTPTSDNKSPKKGQEKTPGKGENKGQKESGGGQTPQKKTIEGGVMIEDLKVGNGPLAKTGKIVQVYYEGRLKSNNKMFDSSKDGNGFKFRLGRQEVIKGWDVGVAGMKVGGKRRIICPPSMAYGAKGSPPVIPAHSTLVFEVELKQVK